MTDLHLALVSFADMTIERALKVGQVFDAHPELRPTAVGGDPARIRVGSSLEALIESQGVPVEWLTAGRAGHRDDGASGEIKLFPGRGGWIGSQDSGAWEFSLAGHVVEMRWRGEPLPGQGPSAESGALLAELAVAMDGAYGFVSLEQPGRRVHVSAVAHQLPGVFPINYFGPAFLRARPWLMDLPGAVLLTAGGVLVRTGQQKNQAGRDGAARLRTDFGEEAFRWRERNPALPTTADHVDSSPGTSEMPWEPWLRERASEDRSKRYRAARRRLAQALEGRVAPVLDRDPVEWSSSLDQPDWQDLARELTKTLRGDFTTAAGRATLAVIASAPPGEADSVLLQTKLGPVQLQWHVKDPTTVDVWIHGSEAVQKACDTWHHRP